MKFQLGQRLARLEFEIFYGVVAFDDNGTGGLSRCGVVCAEM